MKQSKKIIGVLSVLCVALVITVAVLLVKVLTPQASGPREQQQTVDGQVQAPGTQTPGEGGADPIYDFSDPNRGQGNQNQEAQEQRNQDQKAQGQGNQDQKAQEQGNQDQGNQDIGREAAQTAALAHAGLSEAEVTGMEVEQDWDDGRLEYEIEFWRGNTEYDYTIDGLTGAVLKYEQEQHSGIQAPVAQAPDGEIQVPAAQIPGGDAQNSSSAPAGQDRDQGSQDIGHETAKSAALTHAGLSETQVTGMKVEQDWENGRLEYEVEFKSGGMEYDYTIDGATGAVLSFEKDVDD
ncbi:MAG: PepSY domain-containing protein [Firmicutes bacterium]|nr:PepSY domain-containing protein [Bacillota bacterium]